MGGPRSKGVEPGGTGVRNRGWNLGVQGLGTGGGTWGYRG